MKILFICYLFAFVAANLIVKHFGAYGLWFSSFVLIPFDFVARCIIHEKFSGLKLIVTLFILTLCAGIVTILINFTALNIALASVCGFTAAQIGAGIFYQSFKHKNYFIKVNISDVIAIVFDSIVFQYVAFLVINPGVTVGQVAVKSIGGLIWYFILFKKIKIHTWKI